MKFIVDAQLLQSLSMLLNSLGADCIHTLNLLDKNRTEDDVIMRIAIHEKRIVVTKDNDFLQSHLLKNVPEKLLLVNTGNISNKTLLELFAKNFQLISEIFKAKDFIELTKADIIVHD